MSKKRRTFHKNLKCILTTDEKREYSKDIARGISKEEALEDEKTAVAANFTSRIKDLKKDYRELAKRCREGYEFRDVECFAEPNYEDRKMYTFRLDTMEIVSDRKLTSEELQEKFGFENEADGHIDEGGNASN